MRLLRLDLHAFGAFGNVSIDLGRPDGAEPGLTIVYGPNEAGKSTALRAVRQLFFGIDGDRDAFRFPKAKLRIGGVLLDDGGNPCGGVRRGSRKVGLYDSDNKKALADDSPFATLLARLDVASYGTAYGLDHDDLQSGAEAIAASEGSLDAALYAATARVKDLQGVQRDLIEKSETLFTPLGRSGKKINSLIGELSNLDKEAAKAKQPIEDFRRLRTQTEGVLAEVESLEREKAELDARLALLQRFADLFGDRVARKRLAEELDSLARVPAPEGDLEGRWESLKTAFLEATARSESVRASLETTSRELASLGEPSRLSHWAERIVALDGRALLLESEGRDVEESERGRAALRRSAESILAAIGASVSHAELEGLALPKNFAETIRELVDQRVKLDAKDAEDEGRLRLMQERFGQLQDLPSLADLDARIGGLDERLRAATEAAEKLSAERDRAAETLRTKSAAIEAWIERRFDPPIDWKRLPSLPAPTSETIEDEIERQKKFDERGRTLAARRREIDARLAELNRRLDAAAAENLPSQEDLVAARRRRDETLQQAMRRFADRRGEESPADELERLADEIREADRVADVLAREADRCAKLRQDRSEAASLRDAGLALESELREHEEGVRAATEVWNSLWTSIGAYPGAPKEMRTWRRDWEALSRDVAEASEADRERQRLDARIQAAFDALQADVEGSHPAAVGDADRPDRRAAALTFARQAKRKAESEREEAAKLRTERDLLERHIGERAEDMRSSSRRRTEWQTRWDQSTSRLPQASRVVPSETLAFLDQFADWSRLREKERELDERSEAFARKRERFFADVDAMANELGELNSTDRLAQVRRWNWSLAAARARDEHAARLREQHEKHREDASKADERLDVARRALAEFAESLGGVEAGDVPQQLQDIRRKRQATEKSAELDDRLRRLLPRHSWDDLDRELADRSPETLDAEIASLRERIDRLGKEANAGRETLGQLKEERKKWDGTSRAAEIEQSKQRLLAELSEQAELYATYRLAASALKTSIERYRERNKSPILERAGKFFSRLTLGRYASLEPHDRSEGGIAVLGVRAAEDEEPREVPVSGMSRGTRDQLYLAFRMALWEERLEKSSPVPIVLDDVLVHFDDDRTKAALRAFDELARRTQIVYFTHHERLCALAQEVVPKERLLVCEL